MKYLLLSLILLYCHIIQVLGVLEWTVVGKVTEYGQNATLFCHVPNCCPKDSGWDRWTPLQQTLFIDVKTGRPNKKYDGKIFKDGYTLIIQNLTEQDLNVSYSCLYDFTLGERKFLLVEDVFTYIRTGHSGKRRLADGEIELAIATGGSVKKLQWKKAREAVIPPQQPRASVNQRIISIVSSSTTSPESSPVASPVSTPAASPVSTPAHTPETSPTQPPMISPAFSVTSPTPVLTEQLPQTNSIGVHFKVGDNVCIASGGKTYDFATVEKIWSSRVDITYLKKRWT